MEGSRTAIGVEVEAASPDEEGTDESRRNMGVEAPGEATERGSVRPIGAEESWGEETEDDRRRMGALVEGLVRI